jgi:hypothetical protein
MPTKRNRSSRTGRSFGTTSTGTGRNWNRGGMSFNLTPAAKYSPMKFTNCRKQISAKIASFRTINQQISPSGKVVAFSPTTANRWINLVNQGNVVYKFTNQQFNQFFGRCFTSSPRSVTTPTGVCKVLQKQFGQGIKAVTKGKGGTWLIAASPNVSGRPFQTYNFR